jgi:hypothetical protein
MDPDSASATREVTLVRDVLSLASLRAMRSCATVIASLHHEPSLAPSSNLDDTNWGGGEITMAAPSTDCVSHVATTAPPELEVLHSADDAEAVLLLPLLEVVLLYIELGTARTVNTSDELLASDISIETDDELNIRLTASSLTVPTESSDAASALRALLSALL